MGLAKTALSKIGRQAKVPHGLCAKMTAVVILGLCFIFVWSFFSSTPDSLAAQRESFSDIADPAAATTTPSSSSSSSSSSQSHTNRATHSATMSRSKHKQRGNLSKKTSKNVNVTVTGEQNSNKTKDEGSERSEVDEENQNESVVDGKEDAFQGEGEGEGEGDVNEDPELENGVDVKLSESEEDDVAGTRSMKKHLGPMFDPKAHYSWKLCNVRSKHNYIPCIDIESPKGKIQRYRHHEKSCPSTPPMCLVSLPPDGYETTLHWSQTKTKILYKNVAHPKLAAYIKTNTWAFQSGEYLVFPQNRSNVVGGVGHYLESIVEMVPDIEWGKNVRVVLDIGVIDSSFTASLFDKSVLTLSLGLNNDLVDLAQIAIERGFPAIVSPFANRRLPLPSSSFDAIHCGGCNMHWQSNGGKKLLELNRILRPGGYFVLSEKHSSIEKEEAMTSLTAAICWNVLADKTDEVAEVGVKIYQKADSNSIYELRRKKNPPLCKESENPDAAWYIPIRHCLDLIPTAIEQHGTEWPAEWPKRLESYPDWLSDKEKVKADTKHWKAIVDKSYLTGMGIDWTNIRNVMDMKAIYGGFAAALSEQNVWVMNVVPVHAPNTLPLIYERGLFGIYHDWCESFGTYPRSYDLLHADHLFSRLKSRCNQPVAIVVEMDRILRPRGWVIVRDKAVILESLERIFRSLNWDIHMTFAQDKEGILVAQKTIWRP
ncbi:probable methyltransferase PMT28 isoform X1 [Beta vulgaris subsp. vulgaris]|uniref:probable methyltransferase PMT28 isoform X1 n=1 Tax=Beta vulgaris subsp. vulgaris TaxID=3555 RepID=UPI002036CBFF|nr:probable methyltransferase PMT28 isoform X1 [Beta vulgaris subsp. vulgaris]